MGSTIQANCPCGFESDGIDVGAGFANPGEICLAPAFSKRTGRIMSSNFWGKSVRGTKSGHAVFYMDPSMHETCPDGGETEIVYSWAGWNEWSCLVEWDGWDEGDGSDDRPGFVLHDINYRCPECGKMSMRFGELDDQVIWD